MGDAFALLQAALARGASRLREPCDRLWPVWPERALLWLDSELASAVRRWS